MNSQRTQIRFLGVALLITMAAVAAWSWRESSPPPGPGPGQTNLVASRVLRRTVPELQQAFQAFRVRQGVASPLPPMAVDGSLSIIIVDCMPPASRSLVPVKVRPWLVKLGWRPPPRAAFWIGTVDARSEAHGRTRLSIFQRAVGPTNAIGTGQAYLDGIVAELKR